ncbi:Ets domain [Trinorchestia longiramus]|nr:Ets domain [Trinorchestia longiramus]
MSWSSNYPEIDDFHNFENVAFSSQGISPENRSFLFENLEQTVVHQIGDCMAQSSISAVPSSFQEELEGFRSRNIEDWSSEDCFDWALATCREESLQEDDSSIYVFKLLSGEELLNYRLQDFTETMDSNYGPVFYRKFKEIAQRRSTKNTRLEYTTLENMQPCYPDQHSCSFTSTSQDEPQARYSYDSGEFQDYRSMDFLNSSFESSVEDGFSDPMEDSLRYSNSLSPFRSDARLGSSPCHSNSLEPGIEELRLEDSCSLKDSLSTRLRPVDSNSSIASNDAEIGALSTTGGSPAFSSHIFNNPDWFAKIQAGGTRKNRTRSPKSWEFVLRLLQNPSTNPKLVRWDDEERGVFRLVQKEVISEMWGHRSSGKTATLPYESFARLLRHHYKSGILLQVREKQMVYQFGPKVMQKLKQGHKW